MTVVPYIRSDNKIGDMGAAALARLLERNSYLTSLDISGTQTLLR
jgi:hypothetical protein